MWFEELAGSPKATLTVNGGHQMTREFRVAWEDSMTFAQAIFGTEFPGVPSSLALDVKMEPFLGPNDIASGVVADPASTTAQYPFAKVIANYNTSPWGVMWPSDIPRPTHDSETVLTMKARISGQFLAVPARATGWEDSHSSEEDDRPVPPEDLQNRILIPLTDYQIEWDWLTNPPRDKLRNFLGKSNSNTFLGCEPETLMCEGADISPSFRPALDPRCYSVNVVLKQRRINDDGTIRGWNHEYREDPAGWQKIVLANGELRYPTIDFDAMFEQ